MSNSVIRVRDEFKETLQEYLDAYFTHRSEALVFNLLSERVKGFGTGVNEGGTDTDSYYQMFKHDFETVTKPIRYKTYDLTFEAITEDVVVAMFQNDIEFVLEDQDIIMNHIRQSIILRRTDKGIVIDHIHASLPAAIQGENESFPVLQIKDIANHLQKVINREPDFKNVDYSELEKMVTRDYLTGLANRYKIDEVMSLEINRANLLHTSFSMILLDIDGFKQFNDEQGHLVGDQYLRDIAEVLEACTRDIDLVGRWGGDEFAIILPETDMYQASLFMACIKEQIKDQFKGKVSITFGLASFIRGDNEASLFDRADKNLYKQKNIR